MHPPPCLPELDPLRPSLYPSEHLGPHPFADWAAHLPHRHGAVYPEELQTIPTGVWGRVCDCVCVCPCVRMCAGVMHVCVFPEELQATHAGVCVTVCFVCACGCVWVCVQCVKVWIYRVAV